MNKSLNSYCFVAGVPLSIHTYSTQHSSLISSYLLPSHSDSNKLISILNHPQQSINHQLILISSDGTIFIYDYLNSQLLHTYHTRLSLLFASLRPSKTTTTSSNLNLTSPPPPLTLFLVTKKLADTAITTLDKKSSSSKSKPNKPPAEPRLLFKQLYSTLYALRLNLTSSDSKADPKKTNEATFTLIKILKTVKATCYASSPCGNWLGLVTGQSIWLIRFLKSDLFDDLHLRHQSTHQNKFQAVHLQACEQITSIAFPPKSHAEHFSAIEAPSTDLSCTPCDFFATGSSAGRIALWHALSESQWSKFVSQTLASPSSILPCPTSVSHWHAHAVADLAFTRNGSYLISGGEEAVLVLWRLEDFDGIGQDSKSFLARIGSPITRLSLIDQLPTHEPGVLVTTKDGGLLLVSTASMSVVKPLYLPKMQQLPPPTKNRACILLSLSPPMGSKPDPLRPYVNLLLASSRPTALQVLDGGSGDLLKEVHVTPQNVVSRRDERPMVQPTLQFVALGGQSDHFMATIDTWQDAERGFMPEVTLKLWERNSENSNDFTLVGRIDNPHDGRITSLKVSPATVPCVVSTSSDGTIKLWTTSNILHSPTSKPRSIEWLKSSQLSYRNFEALHSTFSEDGSVLAVLHSRCVSVWDATNHRLIKTVASSSINRLGDFKEVHFVGSALEKLMVLGTRGLGLYELTTSKEIGFWGSDINLVLRIPDSNHIVAFERKSTKGKNTDDLASLKLQNMLTVISLESMKPLFAKKIRPTRAAVFVNRTDVNGREDSKALLDGLVLFTDGGGLLRFGKDVLEQYATAATAKALASDESIQTSLPFQELLSRDEELDFEPRSPSRSLIMTPDRGLVEMMESLLNMPPHLIPPSRMIWNKLLVPSPLFTELEEPKPLPSPSTHDEFEANRLSLALDRNGFNEVQEIPMPGSGMKPITIDELRSNLYGLTTI